MKKLSDVCVADAATCEAEVDVPDSPPRGIRGAVSGTLVGFAAGGAPLVEIAVGAARARVVARTCIPLEVRDLWKELVLLSDENDVNVLFVVGVVQSSAKLTPDKKPSALPAPRHIEVDGRTLVLTAQEDITLQCGAASITLRRDGRIIIRGTHIVSHAAGVNRIRGGSVQLN